MEEFLNDQSRNNFNFENHSRNTILAEKGLKGPTAMKTGTTIAGAVFSGGIVLGADTRATEDTIVADKNCEKIHYIAPNIYCCGAGTAADTEQVTGMISSQLGLLRLGQQMMGTETRSTRIVAAVTALKRYLFRHGGHVGAYLVIGGVDSTGPSLYTVHAHGSVDKLPYVTMGSGSIAAMSVFEGNYKDDMNEEQAVELVKNAIRAGIFNDLGSGSNVDICVIKKNEETARFQANLMRSFERPNDRQYRRAKPYHFAKGTTVVTSETTVYYPDENQEGNTNPPENKTDAMDTN